MKKNGIFALICILLLNTGCASYLSFHADKGYKDYIKSAKALPVNKESPSGSIKLSVIAPEQCGCYLEKANQKKEISEDVPYQCIGFPLHTDDPGKEIKQKTKADNVKSYNFYVFNEFGPVTKLCLERHLGAYFNQVNVDLKSTSQDESSESSSVISYYTKSAITSDKYLVAKLIAISDNGNVIEAVGEATDKMGNENLIWYVPISIVTFPLGWAICTIILNSNYKNLMTTTIARSIDIAAAELSKKLAEAMAQNPEQYFEIYVLLE